MSQPTSKKIQSIYTDGACSGNPGPGGWGVVVYFQDGAVHELGGGEPATTNNRMELQAAIAALTYLNESRQAEPVTLYTDSQYVQNGITKWVKGWKTKGWKTAGGKPVQNQDLWQDLDRLAAQVSAQLDRPLDWQYVKAHAGNVGNERCDAIAQAFAQGGRPSLTVLSAAPPAVGDTNSLSPNGDHSLPADGAVATEPAAPSSDDCLSARHGSAPSLATMIEPLRLADEIAAQGYLITTSELARLTGVSVDALANRGDRWVWRNWQVSRAGEEGEEALWQLQRTEIKKR
ncbi:MAG: ribonuclease HI [Elainellaceae cyanobacterium]